MGGSGVIVSEMLLVKWYKTLLNSAEIRGASADQYFRDCQMALPAVIFSEAIRNLIVRRWVSYQFTQTVGTLEPGQKIPPQFKADFLEWSNDSIDLFIEDPCPPPKLLSRLAVLKRKKDTPIPLLDPQYIAGTSSMRAKFEKVHINIVVIGHSDCGKSTTAGHLVCKLGGAENGIQAAAEHAAERNKSSLKYAFIFDKTRAERDRGVTIDIAMHEFETTKYWYTITDAPGHRDYIRNMITGASQADCALLIIDSTSDAFEAGISKDGQTREHILLAYALGIKQMICCCNKIDATNPPYSEAEYNNIVKKVKPILENANYDIGMIPFVPISGFYGDNLIESSLNTGWYKGPTLLEALDQNREPMWLWRKPLRIPLLDVYRFGDVAALVGSVRTGILRAGMTVSFGPTGLTAEVKDDGKNYGLRMHKQAMHMALPGDMVRFCVDTGLVRGLKRGHVASDLENDPAKEALSFQAEIIVLGHSEQIQNGYSLLLHCH